MECVPEDFVELLLILLCVGHRRDVCADEGEVDVACQWDAHGHQPVVDPFWKGSKLGDEKCVRMAKPAPASLGSSAALIATPEESVASTNLR